MRFFIHTYFPKLIFLGVILITLIPLIVSPETIFPYVVGRSLWFRGIIYCISAIWLILIWVDRSYIPDKSTLILSFGLFVLFQALAGLFGLSPVISYWGNFERMEGVVEHTHWLIFILVATATIRKKVDWIKILKINTVVGSIVALLGFFEYFGIIFSSIPGIELFPVVTEAEASYTLGERVESTIGNPAYLSAYLSLILFASFGLVAREFQRNYKVTIINTYLDLSISNKMYTLLSLICSPIILFTIITAGSRGAVIGIIAGLFFTFVSLAFLNKKFRKYGYLALLVFIISITSYISLLTLMEVQENKLRYEILQKYFPVEIFMGDPTYNPSNDEAVDKYPDIAAKFTVSELLDSEDTSCSDKALVTGWLVQFNYGGLNNYNVPDFQNCSSVMKAMRPLGTGLIYTIRTGFDFGFRGFAWGIALKGFTDNPILGIGPENFPALHYKYLDIDRSASVEDQGHLDRAHNQPLHILATSGILGFLSMIFVWVCLFWMVKKNITKFKNESFFWISIGAILVTYFVSSLFMFSIASTYLQLLLIIAVLSRSEIGFSNSTSQLNTKDETKELRYFRDTTTAIVTVLILLPLVFAIRGYVYKPFHMAKSIPPAFYGSSVVEMEENINIFPPMSNWARTEFLMYLPTRIDTSLTESEDFARDYTVLTTIVDSTYNDGVKVDPNDFNLHLAAGNMYLNLANYEPKYLDKSVEILDILEILSPNSVQVLEIKIRTSLLKNDDIRATKWIRLWREVMAKNSQPPNYINFWDESLGILTGEIIPEWELNCKNNDYPEDKVQFEDSGALYIEELDNNLKVAIKKEGPKKNQLELVAGNIVTMEYTGWLENGCIFDSSYISGDPLTFITGKGLAIPGMENGLIGRVKGDVVRIVIPPELAYGNRGIKKLIPPNSTIYFEVEILEVAVAE